MSPEERSALKQAIEGRIASVREEITSLEKSTRPVPPDVAIGRLTRMDAIVNKSVTEAGLATARQTLIRLESSLKQADSPDFGECEVCLKPIGTPRMLAMPEATLCVACAAAAEED